VHECAFAEVAMLVKIGKSCFDRDKSCADFPDDVYLDSMTYRWHPALRLLIIVGGAASLWAVVLAALL
jgi:hypothetical protein